MEITYNIQTIYTYCDEDYRFSRKVSRRIWKYALSTPDFRSFLEAKSRECSDTISRMNQELRNVAVTFHISYNEDEDTPFVESAECFSRQSQEESCGAATTSPSSLRKHCLPESISGTVP
ncbi:hypothetical protein ACIXNK_05335 [Bacteroides fragilis]